MASNKRSPSTRCRVCSLRCSDSVGRSGLDCPRELYEYLDAVDARWKGVRHVVDNALLQRADNHVEGRPSVQVVTCGLNRHTYTHAISAANKKTKASERKQHRWRKNNAQLRVRLVMDAGNDRGMKERWQTGREEGGDVVPFYRFDNTNYRYM